MYRDDIDIVKMGLVDKAFSKLPALKSCADLGACWGVDGGYSRYALENAHVEKAVIVDQHITDPTIDWVRDEPRAHLVSGLFGDNATIDEVGDVDIVFFFDVLLHQVAPDWDEVLARWSKNTKYFLIHNPMWTVGRETIRFPNYGFEWFKANVVYQHEGRLKDWFSRHDAFDADQGKKLRDVHNFWQFGITDEDMRNVMNKLGFECIYQEYFKSRSGKPWIKNYGYIFKRKGL